MSHIFDWIIESEYFIYTDTEYYMLKTLLMTMDYDFKWVICSISPYKGYRFLIGTNQSLVDSIRIEMRNGFVNQYKDISFKIYYVWENDLKTVFKDNYINNTNIHIDGPIPIMCTRIVEKNKQSYQFPIIQKYSSNIFFNRQVQKNEKIYEIRFGSSTYTELLKYKDIKGKYIYTLSMNLIHSKVEIPEINNIDILEKSCIPILSVDNMNVVTNGNGKQGVIAKVGRTDDVYRRMGEYLNEFHPDLYKYNDLKIYDISGYDIDLSNLETCILNTLKRVGLRPSKNVVTLRCDCDLKQGKEMVILKNKKDIKDTNDIIYKEIYIARQRTIK